MNDASLVPLLGDDETWTLRRGVRVAVGLLAGFWATGIAAGLGRLGTFLDVDLPLFDLSALILMAPVIVVPGFAAAVLRGRAAVVAITAGAVAAPIGVTFFIDGSCPSGMFGAAGLLAAAFYALVIAGLAAFVGDRIGGSPWFARNRRSGVSALVIVGATGVLGWVAYVATLNECP